MKPRHFLLLATLASLATAPVGAHPANYDIRPDVVYGHKMGMALTMDVITPKANANGAGILFMVSGGWVSAWMPPEAALSTELNNSLGFTTLLNKGYTIFLVRHGSSPLFKVPECIEDVRRAARHVRRHAANWGVDPSRLGVYGASAGGHLSLMLGTTGEDAEPNASDPLEKAGSRVAAVVAIFPPTELKSYLESEGFRQRFPALQFDAADWRPVSPIEQVTSDDAPTLLLHGDRDDLVPDSHSRSMHQALKDKGVASDLIIFPGAGHGFSGADRDRVVDAMVAWFDTHLVAPEFSLAGVWQCRATLPDDAQYPSRMTFAPVGDDWQGDSESEHGSRKIERIAMDGRKLKFEIPVELDGEAIVIKVNAEADGAATLSGRWAAHRDEGSDELIGGPWEATRETKSATHETQRTRSPGSGN